MYQAGGTPLLIASEHAAATDAKNGGAVNTNATHSEDDQRGHPWFWTTNGRSVTNHNGWATSPGLSGTLPAFRKAYQEGYRWFQVDALPIRDNLISRHAMFGRKLGFLRKSRDELQIRWPHVPTLWELLTDGELTHSCWNIELKSKKGLKSLRELLTNLKTNANRDLRTILVSSPMRPAVLKSIAKEFPDVALAAPVIHGGFFGKMMLGSKRAHTYGGREFDCQQVWKPFLRAASKGVGHPVRQAWTIVNTKQLDRILRTDAAFIVDSSRVRIRPRVEPSCDQRLSQEGRIRPTRRRDVDALALGGGGWRGAFGSIGAIMYFRQAHNVVPPRTTPRSIWAGVLDVVGISGGAFAVAALAQEPDGQSAIADLRDRDDPGPALTKLAGDLQGAGRRAIRVIFQLAVSAAILMTLMVLAGYKAVKENSAVALGLAAVLFLAGSFLLRLVASVGWRGIVEEIYGKRLMRSDEGGDASNLSRRRYAIGATGLNDGRLYSFTSTPCKDRTRWCGDRDLPIPQGGKQAAHAVIRATALPGLGQLGARKIFLPTCDHDGSKHRGSCEWVPDQLVDGGLSGIFGTGMVQVDGRVAAAPGVKPLVVVVDAGRKLVINNDATFKDRAAGGSQRASALLLIARWLKVALDVAYTDALERYKDGESPDGCFYRLVRLAENEEKLPGLDDEEGFSEKRADALNKLYVLQEQVHRFSLLNADRKRSNLTIAAAVAACALEFEHEPKMEEILSTIGSDLGRDGQLEEVWTSVRVVLLDKPGQFWPEEVRCTQTVDELPTLLEVADRPV
jgi:hypothetical protein